MTKLTAKQMLEILEHEAVVLEAYKDSVGVWTWGVGVTEASGHSVARYKDRPQTLKRCLEVFEWLLRERYLPAVLDAFEGHTLKEHELAAALSFHYNTGAIYKASWVTSFKQGKLDQARTEFMNWCKPKEITARRRAERDLFFNADWKSDGRVVIYGVRKPSYQSDWKSAQFVDVRTTLQGIQDAAS